YQGWIDRKWPSEGAQYMIARICGWRPYLLAAVLIGALAALSISPAASQTAQPDLASAPSDPTAAMPQYRRALEEYNKAWQSYVAVASAYWNLVSERRQLRNGKRARGEPLSISDYVLAQPPVYTGPAKPVNPLKPEARPRPAYVPDAGGLRVLAGLLALPVRYRPAAGREHNQRSTAARHARVCHCAIAAFQKPNSSTRLPPRHSFATPCCIPLARDGIAASPQSDRMAQTQGLAGRFGWRQGKSRAPRAHQ